MRADERAPAPKVDPDTEVAQRAYQQGLGFYDQGRYEEAILAFQRGNAVKPRAAFDYNIARCHDRLARWQDALNFYRRYLASPDAARDPDQAAMRARVEQLRERIAAPAAPSSPTAPASPTAVPVAATAPRETMGGVSPGRTKKLAGILVAVGGGAMLATGIVFGALAQQASDDITTLDRTHGTYDSGAWSKGQTDQVVETVLLVAGAAAVVAGVVLYALGAHDARTLTASLVPLRGGGAATVRVEF